MLPLRPKSLREFHPRSPCLPLMPPLHMLLPLFQGFHLERAVLRCQEKTQPKIHGILVATAIGGR